MRESGILMHITSLPSPYGIGTMGAEAYSFVDFLKEAGQSVWQLLPLNPTGYGDSPYQSCSTFAGNPYLIDLDQLIRDGLLTQEAVDSICWQQTEDRVDFGIQYENRRRVLRMAYDKFADGEALDSFCRENSDYLADYALFMALKDENDGKPWYQWDDPLKFRDPDALWHARQSLKDTIRFYSFQQYLFDSQWKKLRAYANAAGVRIIGDVPIYVPIDSVEVWVSPELFQLDQDLKPEAVAGCPPDAFCEDGQLWGNPLYRWEKHARDGYNWWIRRMAAAAKRYDVTRIDHFRGFESYYCVPYGEPTARNGKWVKGPGMALIDAFRKGLPGVEMIAEDLGFITPEVIALRDGSGFPGMKIVQFGFDTLEANDYSPHNYTRRSVCYTGTHDNMPVKQWLESLSPECLRYAAEYMTLNEAEGSVWGVIRTAMSSVSDLSVVQMQDVLELGEEGRMNSPGTTGTNWTWRAQPGFASHALAQKIYCLTKRYDRLGAQK